MLGHRKLETADYLAILSRRKWVILVPLIIFPVLATIATYIIPPRYQSQTLVIIDQQKVPDEYVKSIVSADLDSRLSSMKEQILSRSRIQPIIERYNLYANSRQTMDEKVDQARKDIVIKVITSAVPQARGLPGFFILFSANEARTAQLVCSDITALFVNENMNSRQASAEGTTDFLKGQLDDARHSLDEHDAKLAAFQKEHFGLLPSEQGSNTSMLGSINTQLEAATQALGRLEQDKIYQESMLSQLGGSGAAAEVGGSSSAMAIPNPQRIAKETELQQLQVQEGALSAQYTADYPDVVSTRRKIAELRRQIAQMPATVMASPTSGPAPTRGDVLPTAQLRAQIRSSEAAIQSKRREQEQLQAQARSYQGKLEASPLVAQQYEELNRDYQTAKTFYDDLLAKMNHSKMATDLERRQEGEQFRVIDPANLPDSPTFPKLWAFVAGGVLGGLFLGLLVTAYLEYRDTSLRTERDVWAFTQLPTLAVIGFIDEGTAQITLPKKRRFFGKKTADTAVVGAG